MNKILEKYKNKYIICNFNGSKLSGFLCDVEENYFSLYEYKRKESFSGYYYLPNTPTICSISNLNSFQEWELEFKGPCQIDLMEDQYFDSVEELFRALKLKAFI